MTKAELFEFMASQTLAVLGSISLEGAPQSALVEIAVTDKLEIVFDTLDTARKYQNLIADRRACFVIGWEDEKTVQYEGEAVLLKDRELGWYRSLYVERRVNANERQNWPGIAYFVVRPRWIRFSDFSHLPPLIEEHTF